MRLAMGVLVAVCLAASGSASGQEGEDWDFGEDRARDLAIAAVTFENFGVAVRCMGDSLSVVLTGLPVDSGERPLRVQVGDGPEDASTWVSARDSTTAFAIWPRALATQLSRGGTLRVQAPDGDQIRRYAVDLPPSPQSIGKVFQACGRDLRTDTAAPAQESFGGLRWRNVPEIRFPGRAEPQPGLAAIQCRVDANGGLRACNAESEFPEGAGFGRYAEMGAHRTGRVEAVVPGESIEGRSIVFIARYRMTRGAGFPPLPSRLPPRDEIAGSTSDD
jgi:hypothetical protein